MIKALTALIARPRTLHAELELDHVEISSENVILGLQIKWSNSTHDRIDIRGVVIKLFHKGKKETPIQLIYHGRFVRIPYQKAVTKIAGATSFHIGSDASQTECLRFLTCEIRDLFPGTYAAELHSIVEEGTYLHEFDVKVVPQIKHYMARQEAENSPTATTTSSIFSRAMRIGVT